jgi:hypothetical protein
MLSTRSLEGSGNTKDDLPDLAFSVKENGLTAQDVQEAEQVPRGR